MHDKTKKFKVRFLPSGVSADTDDGTLISDAAAAAGVKIGLPCNGNGRCGRCRVTVSRSGEDSASQVLACQTRILSDTEIFVPSDGGKVIASSSHRGIHVDDPVPIVVPSGKNIYGLAVDIGTTTVAASLIDMKNGSGIRSAAGYNRQGMHGDDVLSRMEYAHSGGTEELRRSVLDTINDITDSFNDRDITSERIAAVYVSGNTTMTHLFIGIDPSQMREPPYEPPFREFETVGSKSGLHVNKNARVVCMPSPAAYVGGDVISDIVYSGMDTESDLSLMIDVGTNGEVALGNRDVMLVCSSSAGPAFEGGKMMSGMMARPGAIDSFRIDDNGKFRFTVIGGNVPKGICGSGYIDMLAQLFLNGFTDKKGNFTAKAETVTADGRECLKITRDVYISDADIHNAILTKAAIYSASRALMRGLGVTMDDIGKVYVAGGFGNFINTESAIAAGLLPDIPRDRFVYLGNASLGGAAQALLSSSVRTRISEVFKRATYVDLGSDPVFSDEFVSALFLPHTDADQFPTYLK